MRGETWEGVGSGEVICKTKPRVIRNYLIGFSKAYNVVFNIILRGFCYHMIAYSDDNKCYQRS